MLKKRLGKFAIFDYKIGNFRPDSKIQEIANFGIYGPNCRFQEMAIFGNFSRQSWQHCPPPTQNVDCFWNLSLLQCVSSEVGCACKESKMKIQWLSDVFVIFWKFDEMSVLSRKKWTKKFRETNLNCNKLISRNKFMLFLHNFTKKKSICKKNCSDKKVYCCTKLLRKTWLDYSLRFQNSANHISRNITIRIAKVGKPVFLSNSTWHTFVVWKIWQNVTFNIH